MKKNSLILILVIALVFGFFWQSGVLYAARASLPEVSVDPRVELLSLIFRLAGNHEYNQGKIPSYNHDVDQYFAPHKDHGIVRLAKKLMKTQGIAFNAVMDMAIHMTDPYSAEERVPLDPLPPTMDKRWTSSTAREFLKVIREFVKESNFKAFIDQHQEWYETSVQRMEKVLQNQARFDWFDTFFGPRPRTNFRILLGLMNGGCCYGARIKLADGRQELYSILGVWLIDEKGLPRFDVGILPTITHEFCHSYTNPLVDKYESQLEKAGQQIYPYVAGEMERQAYSTWKTMMYESLVRACVTRCILASDGAEAARKQISREIKNRFIWMEELFTLLGEYESSRQEYPGLDAFFPRIIEFFNQYAVIAAAKIAAIDKKEKGKWDALKMQAPKILSMVPENGAQDVDPNLKLIKITFDHAMRDQSWSVVTTAGNFPAIVGQVGYDAKRLTFSIPVKLKPDTLYEFSLNSEEFQAFRSEEGVPLIPILVRFKTRKEQ